MTKRLFFLFLLTFQLPLPSVQGSCSEEEKHPDEPSLSVVAPRNSQLRSPFQGLGGLSSEGVKCS